MTYFTWPNVGDRFSKEEQTFVAKNDEVKIIVGVDTKSNRVRISINPWGAMFTYSFTTDGALKLIEFLKGFEDSIRNSDIRHV